MVDTVVAKALLGRDEKIVRVDLGARSYDIKIGRGCLKERERKSPLLCPARVLRSLPMKPLRAFI